MTMTICDLWPQQKTPIYTLQNANGVPYPLDDFYYLQGKPTTDKIAKLVNMLGGIGEMRKP